MTIDIDKLTEEELIELNHRIIERLKFLETYHTHKEMMEFSPGDAVGSLQAALASTADAKRYVA